MTPWAAKWAACWLEPHCRSTVVPGTVSGQPAASTALRATLIACSPTCMTQPRITSSTHAGSTPLRSTRAFSVSAARSTGCQSRSWPLRLPSGVRTASMITAVVMEATVTRDESRRRPMAERRLKKAPRLRAGAAGATLSRTLRRAGDVAVAEPASEVALHGAAIGDVHLPPQQRPRRGELDDDGALVVDEPSRRTTQPSSASPSSRRLRLDRTRRSSSASSTGGRAPASLQGGEHVEPAEREVPLGRSSASIDALQLSGDRLQVSPRCVERGWRAVWRIIGAPSRGCRVDAIRLAAEPRNDGCSPGLYGASRYASVNKLRRSSSSRPARRGWRRARSGRRG